MKKLYVEFSSDKELYLSYMPFFKEGGLFVKTAEIADLGTNI